MGHFDKDKSDKVDVSSFVVLEPCPFLVSLTSKVIIFCKLLPLKLWPAKKWVVCDQNKFDKKTLLGITHYVKSFTPQPNIPCTCKNIEDI